MADLNAAELFPEEKVKFIENQIHIIRDGNLDWILCPYCGGENYPTNELLCCKLFKDASEAIMSRIEQQEALDFTHNVADRAMSNATKRFVN